MRSFVIFRFKFNPWQQLKPLYSKTDTLPKVVYKDLDERPLPKIEMQGRTYLGDAMRSLKPEEVQSIDVDKTRQVMLVELKPGYHPVLMSLSDIKKKYTNLNMQYSRLKITLYSAIQMKFLSMKAILC
ncbi:hypothetical protein AACH28_05590 [Sphingobacterium thalpophilum]|uniref:Uncharacterized protein n=1 Tax=Sphingobacterium thalpophilum TaxID=259 RepID=A0ACD5C597_9SPHI